MPLIVGIHNLAVGSHYLRGCTGVVDGAAVVGVTAAGVGGVVGAGVGTADTGCTTVVVEPDRDAVGAAAD